MADLCSQLHTGTLAEHNISDKLINLKLFVVATNKKLWSNTMANFYFIFKSLEEELFKHNISIPHNLLSDDALQLHATDDHEYIWSLYIPEILRTKAFEKDLNYFFGENWSDVISPSAATCEFMERIHEVGNQDPFLLVAYCHSFYLGLMAGGQIIIKTVTQSIGLKKGLGTAAFQFEQKTSTQLKKQLKQSINSLDVGNELREKIINEKILAYRMTNAIVKEIRLEPSSFAGLIKLMLLFVVLPMVLAFVVLYFGILS